MTGLVRQAEGSPLGLRDRVALYLQPVCPSQVEGGRSGEGTGRLDVAHRPLSSAFAPREHQSGFSQQAEPVKSLHQCPLPASLTEASARRPSVGEGAHSLVWQVMVPSFLKETPQHFQEQTACTHLFLVWKSHGYSPT